MNIIYKLTLRHMKLNRKRTIVTMIGIIISVAMITAVSVVGYSIMDYMARTELEYSGHFHLKLADYVYGDNEMIEDELGSIRQAMAQTVGDYGYERTDEGELVIRSYDEAFKEHERKCANTNEGECVSFFSAMRVMAVQSSYYEMMNIELAKGDYPQNQGEILVSYAMSDVYREYDVGDKVVIGAREYVISGFIADTDYESINLTLPGAYAYPMYTYLDVNDLSDDDIVSSYIYVEGIKDGIEQMGADICDKLDASYVAYNHAVLKYYGFSGYGNMDRVVNKLKLVLVVIIMVGSVALIANGFTISISERSRYLGMLASIGATKKQKRSSVYFEGFIEGMIGIPLGILAGIGGMAVTFKCISPLIRELSSSDVSLDVVVNWNVILWTVGFSALTIFLSAYIPAKRASRIMPIDAIRQNKDVKVSSKAVKTMKLTRKIFGFEGDLALKNLKRNKKRYRVTVFSMFISLTLFISVYSIVYFFKAAYSTEVEAIGYDMAMCVYLDCDSEGYTVSDLEEMIRRGEYYPDEYEALTDNVLNSKYIEEGHRLVELQYGRYNTIEITDYSILNEKYLELWEKQYDGEWEINEPTSLVSMEEEELREYLDEIDIDYEAFVSDDHNAILCDNVKEHFYFGDDNRVVFEGHKFSKDITELTLLSEEHTEDGKVEHDSIDFNVIMSTEKLPNMDEYCSYLLITPAMAAELCDRWDSDICIFLSTCVDINDYEKYMEYYNSEYERSNVAGISSYSMRDVHKYKEQMDKSLLLISVFVYGFIVLISLICVANIVNTISTSIALRKREFCMLKSVGMTDRAFRRMIAYESAFYGLKAVLFGLPVGTAVMLMVRHFISNGYEMTFGIPWMSYVIAVLGIFAVIGVTMLYSSGKIKRANIIDALREENV